MYEHRPVLLDEVLDLLKPESTGIYIDCTFGRGGYTAGILKDLGPEGKVIALDRDPEAIRYGLDRFSNERRLTLIQEQFSRLPEVLATHAVSGRVNGIVFDLGVSSPQLDDRDRGFSFAKDGPLDMRMDPSRGISAAGWLNVADEKEIERVVRTLGEERFSRPIAKRIVAGRSRRPILRTKELEEIIVSAFPEKEKRKRRIHPATKTFQAIRMYINDELEQVRSGISAALDGVAVGGKVVAVAFHSLEDRIVKRLFRQAVQGDRLPDKLPVREAERAHNFEYLCNVITASEKEIDTNARARSAKLRAVRRLA